MRVLFVSSGRGEDVGTVVKNQGESLKNAGVDIDYYPMKGQGLAGYLKSLPSLRKTIMHGKYDLVHAHYSLSAFIATFAGSTPIVVSLMGSDIYGAGMTKVLIRIFAKRIWNATIVKTDRMKNLLGLKGAVTIPNGVHLDLFKPESMNVARQRLGISLNSKIVLFISTNDRPEKNLSLAQKAISLLKKDGVELLYVKNMKHELIPSYINAANLLLVTSLYEGSPNIIKEAMACNCQIVTSDVGDVRKTIGATAGCYLTSYDPADIAGKVMQALNFGRRTEGRKRIISLGLDSSSVAGRIIDVYKSVIKN